MNISVQQLCSFSNIILVILGPLHFILLLPPLPFLFSSPFLPFSFSFVLSIFPFLSVFAKNSRVLPEVPHMAVSGVLEAYLPVTYTWTLRACLEALTREYGYLYTLDQRMVSIREGCSLQPTGNFSRDTHIGCWVWRVVHLHSQSNCGFNCDNQCANRHHSHITLTSPNRTLIFNLHLHLSRGILDLTCCAERRGAPW